MPRLAGGRRHAALDEAAGLVIPGGESTTIWKLAAADPASGQETLGAIPDD